MARALGRNNLGGSGGRRAVAAAPSLHRTWAFTVVTLVVLIVGLGTFTFAATQYQRGLFDQTTSQLEQRMSAVIELEARLLEIDEPAAGMMYGLGGPDQYDDHIDHYDHLRLEVLDAFEQAAVAITSPDEAAILARAESSWSAMDREVLRAPDVFATGTVQTALAQGEDPFRPAWDHLTATTETLGQLRAALLEHLRAQTAAVDRIQTAIVPVVLVAVVVALLLAWLAAHRLQRRVLTPIIQLRSAALAMRESDQVTTVTLDAPVAELADLAVTINDTARSLRASHDLLHDQAHTDALTGLANRKAFTQHLDERLTHPTGHQVAVLFVDLDDFKIVNDTMGHAAGDQLLQVVAQRLRGVTREGDLVARLGGDEFAIIANCGARADTAEGIAERALTALHQPVHLHDAQLHIACSIGIALSPTGQEAVVAEELVREANFAMYTAKRKGKNRSELFAPAMHDEIQVRTELRRDLTQAVQQDEFELHYQPVLDLHTNELLGFEALVRWQHPRHGLLSPGAFIALAEDTGDIIDIGAWVLDQACRDVAAYHDAAPDRAHVWVSVNVSARQLTGQEFVDVVTRALNRHGLPARSLVLEITEAIAVTNTDTAATALATLRQQGVAIALDDFGKGFSSLRYIHELPVDVIKIDRSFVAAEGDKTDAALEAMVSMGRRLGLAVVAEGIETPAELQRLQELGPLAGQGFLFARPMPASQAANYTPPRPLHALAVDGPTAT